METSFIYNNCCNDVHGYHATVTIVHTYIALGKINYNYFLNAQR